jgi:ParB/RepB/Spo0J family partition protein
MKKQKKSPAAEVAQAEPAKKPLIQHESCVEMAKIHPDPKNCRMSHGDEDDAKLDELADNIAKLGLIEPLILRKHPDTEAMPGHYMVICGHRRFAACQKVGLEFVRCNIYLDISDKQTAEMQVSENLHRQDLDPIEEAMAYQRMTSELGYTQEDAAHAVGRTDRHVRGRLRLLRLPKELQEMVARKELKTTQADVFAGLSEPALADVTHRLQEPFFERMLKGSVEELRRLVQGLYFQDLESGELGFDKTREYSSDDRGSWPACTACPWKDKQVELFGEGCGKQCPFPECLRAKQRIEEDEHAEEIRERNKQKARAALEEIDGEETDSEEDRETEYKRQRVIDEAKNAAGQEYLIRVIRKMPLAHQIKIIGTLGFEGNEPVFQKDEELDEYDSRPDSWRNKMRAFVEAHKDGLTFEECFEHPYSADDAIDAMLLMTIYNYRYMIFFDDYDFGIPPIPDEELEEAVQAALEKEGLA